MIKYRHEYKYLISNTQAEILKNRLKPVCSLDKNVDEEGKYHIRSIYFDDYDDTCFYENVNGTDPREKYRIRIYNNSTDIIRLECKRKQNGMTLKQTNIISSEVTQKILEGKIIEESAEQKILNKLNAAIRTRRMHPVVAVEYDRIPFVYRTGNVRVTFDYNITSSDDIGSIESTSCKKRPITPTGYIILEVKFNELLPDFLYELLNLDSIQRTTFSKYALCRKYNI